MVFDPRQTKHVGGFEEKASTLSIANDLITHGQSFGDFLLANGHNDLSAFIAIQMYRDAMPLFNAIDMRASAFSQIPIKVWDTKAREFVDHDSLELLKQPNSDVSDIEFLEQISSYYDITGNNFIFAGGRLTKPPLELATVPPQNISFDTAQSNFGILHIPKAITVNTFRGGKERFTAEEDPTLGLRFVQNEDRELWHMRAFNPLRSGGNFWGMSRAKPIWFEIQQYLSGNNTNLSMLKRGTKLSLAWVNNRGEELTETQWSRLQEEALKYKGDMNTGGTPILDGMDVKTIQQTNRDMEYSTLQEAMLSRVSLVYRIPLALLLPKSMTLNNLETSMLLYFDNSVIPHTNRMYSELTRMLMPRYKNSENLEYRFLENDVSALQVRLIETAKRQAEIGVNTPDELRTIIGDEGLAEGGDVVYMEATKVPIGSDAFTDDELSSPKTSSKFIELLTRDNKYTEEEAKQLAIEKGMVDAPQ